MDSIDDGYVRSSSAFSLASSFRYLVEQASGGAPRPRSR
jgi:hypothetical protein